MSLGQLVKNNKIVTFVGAGGVGKTTLSMSVAIYAASKGLKVAAITVDPSKRLARSLGLDEESYKSLKWNSFETPMDVYFLDAEKEFSDFVRKNLSDTVYEKIKGNRVFQQISKNLRETHNFAAIYKLAQILSLEDYDLVVLDTPPSHQAIDFFDAPKKLQRFFTKKSDRKSSGVMSWIQEKSFAAIEAVVMNIAGKEFVAETEGFFSHIGQLRNDIHDVSENFLKIMKSEQSQLVLVGSPALDKMSEAAHLQEKISGQGYSLKFCVVNRSYYEELDLGKEPLHLEDPEEQELYNYFIGQKGQSLQLINVLSSKAYFVETEFIMLPEISNLDVTNESLLELAEKVSKNWEMV